MSRDSVSWARGVGPKPIDPFGGRRVLGGKLSLEADTVDGRANSGHSARVQLDRFAANFSETASMDTKALRGRGFAISRKTEPGKSDEHETPGR